MTKGPIRVTDHALIRFLDQASGLDVEGLRARLEQSLARAHAAASQVGAGDYLIKADGYVFVVRGDNVSTVIEDHGPESCAATLAERHRA